MLLLSDGLTPAEGNVIRLFLTHGAEEAESGNDTSLLATVSEWL